MVIINPEVRKRLLSVAMLMLPLAALKFGAMMFGSTAPQAEAATAKGLDLTEPEAQAAKVERVEWTVSQRRAAAHLVQLAAVPFGPAPVYQVKPLVVVEPEPEPEPEAEPEPQIQPEPEPPPPQPLFALQAVITTPHGNKALINGTVRVAGDRIDGSSWFVEKIDARSRSVTVRNADTGEEKTVIVNLPK